MLKERIQEISDFTKFESPYRKANKGWINQDIFLDLSPSSDTLKGKNEYAKVTLFWTPINTFLSNIFIIIILSSILVFTSLSFANGRFNLNFIDTSLLNNLVKVQDNNDSKLFNSNNLDTLNFQNEQNLTLNELEKVENTDSFDESQNNANQESITKKTDEQVIIEKENTKNHDIIYLENKKSKSNFI